MMLASTQLFTYALCSCALCLSISTLVERALQIHLFLTNKANFRNSQINVTDLLAKDYDKMDTWSSEKNKAKTKPKQSQFKANSKPIQSQNKPKTNPIQTQNEPNLYPVLASGEAGSKPVSRANYKKMANQSLTELFLDSLLLRLPITGRGKLLTIMGNDVILYRSI